MSYLFEIETTWQKMLGPEFGILPTAGEKLAERPGSLPSDTNFGIRTFFMKGTPAQMGYGYFVILCNFVGGCTLLAALVQAGWPRAENQKLQF